MSAWPKVCGCRRSYTAEEWLELPGAGRMDEGEDELDLRTCACRSTLAVLVSDLPNDDRLDFEVGRAARIARLYLGARKALGLGRLFVVEAKDAGLLAMGDHRVRAVHRQVAGYRRAITRQRAMTFGSADAVLEVCLRDELLTAAE